MRYRFAAKTKAGFTLIELLVVITIIAILLGLVTAGVLKYMDTIPQTQTVNDIRQLTVGLETFKTKYGMYPPSSIFLSNNPGDYPAGSPHLAYLYAIWPRLKWVDKNGNPQIDWSGQNNPAGMSPITLEGDQCLVFFLNGPGGAGGTGWSTNPTCPTFQGGPRVGPFFEFPTSRLVWIPHSATGQSVPNNFFLSFMDAYGTATIGAPNTILKGNVYAFFCSGRSAGGYTLDCPTLQVTPYKQANNRFYNNNTFQIISAGKNLAFGPGSFFVPGGPWPWPPGNPAAAYLPGPTNFPVTGAAGSGVDDLSNFSGDFLGVF